MDTNKEPKNQSLEPLLLAFIATVLVGVALFVILTANNEPVAESSNSAPAPTASASNTPKTSSEETKNPTQNPSGGPSEGKVEKDIETPPNAEKYALVFGEKDAPVTVDLYQDYLCPFCAQLETFTSEPFLKYLNDGTLKLKIYPVAYLDGSSTDFYSTRAANAVAAVYDTAGPLVTYDYINTLYNNQPEEGGPGLTDEQLLKYATESGAPAKETENLMRGRTYTDWVTAGSNFAFTEEKIKGTPVVKVNGNTLTDPYTELPSYFAEYDPEIDADPIPEGHSHDDGHNH